VNCVTKDPAQGSGSLVGDWHQFPPPGEVETVALPADGAQGGVMNAALPLPRYEKFTSQDDLGRFLVDHYKIRTPKDLTSCEVCHR
jgi:hypothetical protein